jgi:hypothetical protein
MAHHHERRNGGLGSQEHDRFINQADLQKKPVHNAVICCEDHVHESSYENPRDEVRKVTNRLDELLDAKACYLVQEKGKNNRNRKAKNQLEQAVDNSVPKSPQKIPVSKRVTKVLQPDPSTLCETLDRTYERVVLLEGDDQAACPTRAPPVASYSQTKFNYHS